MECVLFRHGLAVDREDWSGEEDERPLTPKGVEKTRQAAAGLLHLDLAPTIMLASPLIRALETAKLIREAFHLHTDLQRCAELLPDTPPEKLFSVLTSLPPDACVICVGHEPHLGGTAGLMVFGKPVPGLKFKKAAAYNQIDFQVETQAAPGCVPSPNPLNPLLSVPCPAAPASRTGAGARPGSPAPALGQAGGRSRSASRSAGPARSSPAASRAPRAGGSRTGS
jgi:phosphohistidine phosphatase